MKKHLFLIALLLFNGSLFAQKAPYPLVKITDDLYVDDCEVDVGSWLSFYYWTLMHKGTNAAQMLLPDSNSVSPEIWKYITNDERYFTSLYGRNSMYPIGYFEKNGTNKRGTWYKGNTGEILSYPITGITYEQTVAFCEWRTIVNGQNNFVYKLPTIEEWDAIASVVPYPEECWISGKLENCGMLPYPKYNGVYDLYANVSEMTETEGIAKGGNYQFVLSENPKDIVNYSIPQPWLGFRCVARKVQEINKTISMFDNLGNTFIDPRDGKEYPTVEINNRTWLAANLAFEPTEGKYWKVKYEEPRMMEASGYLYDWKTAQNVCPDGWSLPEKSEVEQFLTFYPSYNDWLPGGKSKVNLGDFAIKVGLNYIQGNHIWIIDSMDITNKYNLCAWAQKRKMYLEKVPPKKMGYPVRCVKRGRKNDL